MHLLCQYRPRGLYYTSPLPPTQYITSHHTKPTPPKPFGVPLARYGERWHHTQQPEVQNSDIHVRNGVLQHPILPAWCCAGSNGV